MNQSNVAEEKIGDDLLAENSLWEVYRLSWKLPFPWRLVLSSTMLSCVICFFSVYSKIDTSLLVDQTRQVLDVGISVVSAILGFLIAGFTVFATLTNPKLFVKMAKSKPEGGTMSWLKETFVIFMHTFAHYTWFLISAVFIKLISGSGGIMSSSIALAPWDPVDVKRILATVALSVFVGWFLYVLLLLNHFVFSIYHSCMFAITVAGENLAD